MSDLVERLRGCSFVSKDLYVKSICKEAADEIDRLADEVRQEPKIVAELREIHSSWLDDDKQ